MYVFFILSSFPHHYFTVSPSALSSYTFSILPFLPSLFGLSSLLWSCLPWLLTLLLAYRLSSTFSASLFALCCIINSASFIFSASLVLCSILISFLQHHFCSSYHLTVSASLFLYSIVISVSFSITSLFLSSYHFSIPVLTFVISVSFLQHHYSALLIVILRSQHPSYIPTLSLSSTLFLSFAFTSYLIRSQHPLLLYFIFYTSFILYLLYLSFILIFYTFYTLSSSQVSLPKYHSACLVFRRILHS